MIHEILPHRFDNRYLPNQQINDEDFIFHYHGNTLLVKITGEELQLARKKDFPEINGHTPSVFLFSLNNVSCFLVWDTPAFDKEQFDFREIGFFRTIKQKETGWVALVGYHLWSWYSQHKFCGKCGATTVHKHDERAIICPDCNSIVFPKISPAIIAAITCGDRILLAHNANFTGGWYSLVAGYADVGESLEETLVREVKEEVGLDVRNIRYYKSQPWALSGSLMVGFIAEADDSQPVVIDGHEITTAEWFRRGALPAHPSNVSIAGEMIDKFEKGEL
jgi:NAD+ diphosphatase